MLIKIEEQDRAKIREANVSKKFTTKTCGVFIINAKKLCKQEWIYPNRSVNEDPVQLFSKKVNVTLIELKTWSKIEFKGKKKLEQLVNELRDMSTIL